MKVLSFIETRNLLKKYNITVRGTELFTEEKEALIYAKKIGFPVVLKVSGEKIIHSTEQNAVIVNIKDEKEFKEVFNALDKKFKDKEGILVQKQFKGKELVIGLNYDQTFGPVIMVGLGGIFVEVLNDVSFRVCPIDKKDALAMLEELKGFKTLLDFRGSKEVDLEKLIELLLNLSNLIIKEEDVHSLDFNPVFVSDTEINIADLLIIKK